MSKREKFFCFALTGISFLAYLSLSYFVNLDTFRTLDYQSLVGLQNALSHFLDVPFSLITLLGSSEITILFLGVIFIAILLRQKHFFLGLFLFGFIFLVELMGKLFINHPAPPQMFNRYALNFHFPSGSFIDTHYSYPSGHMARTAFLAAILLFLVYRWKKEWFKKMILFVLIILYAGLVFISRIYLGEHWLSDVLGGLVLGTGMAFFSLSFW